MIGDLYIVATPIGHLDDISKRALDVLQHVDFIACEDTRHSQKLLQYYSIDKRLIPLHQHNEQSSAKQLINQLLSGHSVALISDAGTPLVSDPGAVLTQLAHNNGIKVVPIPGASSVISALSASGLPADQFVFAGFIPAKAAERTRFLQGFQTETRTTVFFETPHRIKATLTDMQTIFIGERVLVLARELTKQFEEICCLRVEEGLYWLEENPYREKGEYVLMLGGTMQNSQADENWQKMADDFLVAGISSKTAANLLTKYAQVKKKVAYQYMIDAKNAQSR